MEGEYSGSGTEEASERGVRSGQFPWVSLGHVYGTECAVVNGRRPEEEGLLAEEQGGLRKMRGCRDEVLSLVLLGQMKMLKKSSGLMVAFIDFSKAYDRIDRGKIWKCLESMGVNGKFLFFLQSLYAGTSCWVKVDDRQKSSFECQHGPPPGLRSLSSVILFVHK